MTQNRDEFSPNTKRILALRAAHRCSNPNCRKLTVKPHSQSGKAVVTGKAAHICAAASGGPRFDASQTSEERSSIANGIWVCGECSDRIDYDPDKYPVTTLHCWKSEHESWVAQEDFVPALPHLKITTCDGLTLPTDGAFSINGDDVKRFRDHELLISSGCRHDLHQLKLQFPESIVNITEQERPAGVEIKIKPERMALTFSTLGNGSVTGPGKMRPTPLFIIEQEKVILGRPCRLVIRSERSVADSIMRRSQSQNGNSDVWITYIEGSFLYQDQGQYFTRAFLVRLSSDESRKVLAGNPEEDVGQELKVVSFAG